MRDGDVGKLFGLLALFFCAVIIYKLSLTLDLPMAVTGKFVFLFVISLLFSGYVIYLWFLNHNFKIYLYPIVIFLYYVSATPILNYRATPTFYSRGFNVEPAFWGTTWFHLLVILSIFIVGYGVIFYKRDNY